MMMDGWTDMIDLIIKRFAWFDSIDYALNEWKDSTNQPTMKREAKKGAFPYSRTKTKGGVYFLHTILPQVSGGFLHLSGLVWLW